MLHTPASQGFIERPFNRAVMTPALEELHNVRMSSVRVAVENGIGYITNTFPALDFDRREVLGHGDVCVRYLVAVIFRNMITCVRGGNAISERFGVDPPSLEAWASPRDDPLPTRLVELGWLTQNRAVPAFQFASRITSSLPLEELKREESHLAS
jgi:hypothetical protein